MMSKLVLALVAVHAALFAALHVLEPQLSPVSGIISDYAATDSAWLASVAFVVFAGLWVALAALLPGGHLSTNVGRALFCLAAVFILIGTVLPASMDPRTGSLLSKIQNLFARPGLFIGVVLVSVGLLRTRGWEAVGRILVGLSVTALVLLVLTIAVLLDRGLAGVGQRLIFVVLYAWAGLTALTARRTDASVIEAGSA